MTNFYPTHADLNEAINWGDVADEMWSYLDREYPYIYSWGNNPVRAKLKGKHCRIVAIGSMNTVMLEFANGKRVTSSRLALRKADAYDKGS